MALPVRGLSSAGRATESHSVGHRFDPDRLHQLSASFLAQPIVFDLRASGATGSTSGTIGALAQLGEHLLCKQGVTGSIPVGSTSMTGPPADGLGR